jgi:type 1 glutamine amidotransferase
MAASMIPVFIFISKLLIVFLTLGFNLSNFQTLFMKNKSNLLRLAILVITITVSAAVSARVKSPKQLKILVYFETKAFYHTSIPIAVAALQKLGQDNNILVDTTSRSATFLQEDLDTYNAIVFMSTTGDVFNETQQDAFKKYINNGGGFVGIHSATDTEYGWPWYNQLVGGYFKVHPKPQEAILQIVDRKHPATKHLPAQWKRFDEWYNFKDMQPGLHILITIDEKSYIGGEMGDTHPMAWCHKFDGGKAFYTEFGHTDESFAEPLFLQHILGGIKYAAK